MNYAEDTEYLFHDSSNNWTSLLTKYLSSLNTLLDMSAKFRFNCNQKNVCKHSLLVAMWVIKLGKASGCILYVE